MVKLTIGSCQDHQPGAQTAASQLILRKINQKKLISKHLPRKIHIHSYQNTETHPLNIQ